MHVAALEEAQAFVTLGGSTIRELVARAVDAGGEPLRLLCRCAPSFRDDDTVPTGG